MKKALLSSVVLTAVVMAGCWNAVVLDAPLPDWTRIAEVRSRWMVQSLWMRFPGNGEPKVLLSLEHQADGCDEIVWSLDNSRVGFLVGGVRLYVFDAKDGSLLEKMDLVERHSGPGNLEARSLRFLEDGSSVQFRECVRGENSCGKVKLLKTWPVFSSSDSAMTERGSHP